MEKNNPVRWAVECRESGTRKRGRPRKRLMDCMRDDGRVADLDKVDDRIKWRKMYWRPNPLEGIYGMMHDDGLALLHI